MKQTFLQGLLMAIGAFLLVTFKTTGLPTFEDGVKWAIIGINVVFIVLGYVSSSIMLPTSSLIKNANWKDIAITLITCASAFFSALLASLLTGVKVDWNGTGYSILGMFVISILTLFFSKPKEDPAL